MEIGQPMHAFDAQLIKDQLIIVRRANPEEKVKTLDGKEQVLSPDVLVIADPEKVIGIAGIMGGANTEVSQTTKTIILESAYFNPISIHKSAKYLKLRTEASIRFEHGVDWNGVEEGVDRAAALIAELGRGEVMRGRIDTKQKDMKTKEVELRLARLNHILGLEIPPGDAISILKRLGFKVKEGSKKSLKVEIPLFRNMDVEREIDLIEEVARIWGYNRIETTMPSTAIAGKDPNLEDKLRNSIREIITGCGLNEAQTYSMLGPADFDKSGLAIEKAIKIANPLTVEESIMRTSLLPGLLKCAAYNQNRQIEDVFIFEIGKTFLAGNNKLPDEKWVLSGMLTGSPFMSALDKGGVDYFYVKGIIENLFLGLGIELPAMVESESHLLQPGKGAEIAGIGVVGGLHPDIQRNFELNKPVFFFELDLDKLLQLIPKGNNYQTLPKFPAMTRDISMFVPAEVTNQKIIDLIYQTGGPLVEEAFPFDKFKDSTAYRLIYRDPDRTLTEEEVNAKQQEIIQALITKLGVKVRQ
jgi:phenylalanyl-tRNA synthetase beta chain